MILITYVTDNSFGINFTLVQIITFHFDFPFVFVQECKFLGIGWDDIN